MENLLADMQVSKRMLDSLERSGRQAAGVSAFSWNTPIEGTVKLNCDGFVRSFAEAAACGGVLRDHNGTFLWGYAVKLGSCIVPQAELWAILHGLKLTTARGFKRIHVETDSTTMVNFINKGCTSSHLCRPLVNEINRLIAEVDKITVTHVHREANQVADLLANHGLSLNMSSKIFDVAPDFLSNALFGVLVMFYSRVGIDFVCCSGA